VEKREFFTDFFVFFCIMEMIPNKKKAGCCMPFYQRLLGHTWMILRHKFWVFYFCVIAGIPWQGLIHDLSKFSPVEFLEGVRYYNGKISPIRISKEKHDGFSMAWIHHHGRNLHHYEAWFDNFDHGPVARDMTYKYAVEMVCDCLGAGKAYGRSAFTLQAEYYGWWKRRLANGCGMSDHMKDFMEEVLSRLAKTNSLRILRPKSLRDIYERNVGKYHREDT
jgi:hypothetical protein